MIFIKQNISIFVASILAPHLLGAIAVAAYSYMSLVPVIQPPILRLLTTQKEREIDMPQAKPVSQTVILQQNPHVRRGW